MNGSEMYESYIGSLSAKEFVGPFNGNVEQAIEATINTWPWEMPIPDGFRELVTEYVDSLLTDEIID